MTWLRKNLAHQTMQMTREDARSHVLEEPVGGILEKELREFVQAEGPGSYDDKIKLPKAEADVFLGGDGPILWGGPVVIKAMREEFGKYSERILSKDFCEMNNFFSCTTTASGSLHGLHLPWPLCSKAMAAHVAFHN